MADDQQQQDGTSESNNAIADFDSWIASQPEAVKTSYSTHLTGLKSALESERAERKAFAKQLKDATAQVEKGSAAEKALQDATAQLEAAQRRATFAEDAIKPEIGCTNIRAAYLVAQADDLFTKAGEPDWKAIKAAAPELFQRKVPTANAGNGTQQPPKANGMNEFIRRSAGRL